MRWNFEKFLHLVFLGLFAKSNWNKDKSIFFNSCVSWRIVCVRIVLQKLHTCPSLKETRIFHDSCPGCSLTWAPAPSYFNGLMAVRLVRYHLLLPGRSLRHVPKDTPSPPTSTPTPASASFSSTPTLSMNFNYLNDFALIFEYCAALLRQSEQLISLINIYGCR